MASYKHLVVSTDELHHIYIAGAMEMQRICDCGKEHSTLFVMSKSFALAHYFALAKSILNTLSMENSWSLIGVSGLEDRVFRFEEAVNALRERVARVEEIVEQMDKRLNHIETELREFGKGGR